MQTQIHKNSWMASFGMAGATDFLKTSKPSYSHIIPMGEKKSKKGIPKLFLEPAEKELMIKELTFFVKAGVEKRDDIYEILKLEGNLPVTNGRAIAKDTVYTYIKAIRKELNIYPKTLAREIMEMYVAGFSKKEISIALNTGRNYVRDCLRNGGRSKKLTTNQTAT